MESAGRQALIPIVSALVIALCAVPAAADTVHVEGSTGRAGIELRSQAVSGVEIHYEMGFYNVDPLEIEGEVFQKISLPEVFLPNDAGAPDLPGLSRFVAMPEGASARLEIVSATTQIIQNIEISPAPVIPRENDDSPLVYAQDPAIYERNVLYPASPVLLSDPRQMRGVDMVILGITPFQYNPVTRELVIYTELDVRVEFEGGSATFGEERLRSRHWEPILANQLINYGSLPRIDFSQPRDNRNGYEYIIITPDNPDFIAWGDTLKAWRKLEGISTECFTTTDIGGTSWLAIEGFLNDAYSTWDPAPAAFLMLGDYPGSGDLDTGLTSPTWNSYCISDNMYADVDGDDLPDMVHGRITARDAAELEGMIGKMLGYERAPYTDPGFYDHPVIAGGWQTERWFILCTEIVLGHQELVLGKSPVREYAIYSGSPTTWSSNSNTYMLLDYFGPSGLGYIPATPAHLTDWGANATRLNNDLNAGAYMLLHRDHGGETGWGEPDYDIGDLSGLSNDMLPFVFSINCLTGKYNYGSQCFTEAFHRMAHGALGVIAASEISYSFVNDTFIFGLFDGMFPDFMPDYGPHEPLSRFATDLRPAFGMANGKHFLQGSSWPYNPTNKDETHHLFHHHGDTFMTMYSEVPQHLDVAHDPVIPIGIGSFTVQANEGAVIGLTVDGEIIGVADATGAPREIPITPQATPGEMLVTITQANHYRYTSVVQMIYPVTYLINPRSVPIAETTPVTVTVWDDMGAPLPDVEITVDGWGIDPVADITDISGEAHVTVTPPYGEQLTVIGRQIGESYNCIEAVLRVYGGSAFGMADIDASVPAIGLFGALAPHYEGTITGTASQTDFTLYAVGCGIDAEAGSGGSSTVDILATPDGVGTIAAAIAKPGFDIYLEDVTVQMVYGTLAGEIYEPGGGATIEGALIRGYPAGSDTSLVSPVFTATSGAGGDYAIEGDLEVDYYDVYASKFGYLAGFQEVFVQVGANDADFYLDFAPSGVISGTVVQVGTGHPLTATIKLYRGDTGELYAQTTSDSLAAGYYQLSLPYFDYVMNVRAWHHIPQTIPITVDQPNLTFDFVLEETLANILILNDDNGDCEQVKLDKSGNVIATDGNCAPDGDRSSAEIAADLVEIGYDVTEETSSSSDPQTWINYDFLISASGDDISPVSDPAYRSALEAYVLAGGKLLIEGGEVAYDAVSSPGYPTFAATVLHVVDWEHDQSGNITVHNSTHPITTFPNVLGTISCSYSGYGDQDSSIPDAAAQMICAWSSYATLPSVQIYDDNPDPASCQIIYYAFNYAAAEAVGRRDLLENSITYLIAPESAPTGGMTGTVTLQGETNHSGVTVTAYPGGASAVTVADGTYEIPSMYAGTYTVEARKAGWSVGLAEGVVVTEGQQTTGIDFLLTPTFEYEYCEAPALPIPDNNPAGVYDTCMFEENTTVTDVEIYVNITHTYVGDLIVEITSPQGTTVRLHNRTGGSANDIVGWYDSELVVDGPGTLDDFTAESAQGEWEIWVSDNAGIDTGTLNNWCVMVVGSGTTGIGEGAASAAVPLRYILGGVTPNPFNPVTTISYGLPHDGPVELAIYNVAGQRVKTLVDGVETAGYFEVAWNGRDDAGASVASGIYFCRMTAAGFDRSTKMVLLK